ncbi:hypothetical protein SLE2022_216070 [Rubroshorea leprosula]
MLVKFGQRFFPSEFGNDYDRINAEEQVEPGKSVFLLKARSAVLLKQRESLTPMSTAPNLQALFYLLYHNQEPPLPRETMS